MVTILSGAGASYAIDNVKFPTTVKFAERLPDDIKKSDVFLLFHDFLEKKYPGRILDIELYLWEMIQTHRVFGDLANSNTILGKAYGAAFSQLTREMRSRQTQSHLDPNRIGEDLRRFNTRLQDLKDKINQKVFDFYAQSVTEAEISKNWLLLIRSLFQYTPEVTFHTLNYDLIPETISDCLKPKFSVFEGKVTSPLVRIDPTFWREKKYLNESEYNLTITKLHGSIDWRKKTDGSINFGNEEYSGNLENHLLLYPGYEKVVHEEPYKSFYDYFEHCIRASNIIIVVGYAFRDEAVNILLRDALRESNEKQLHIIDIMNQIDHGLPESQVFIHTGDKTGFGEAAISELMNEIRNPALNKSA